MTLPRLDAGPSLISDAAFSLTRGAQAAQAIDAPNVCDFTDAVADLINALGRARWCERSPHRDPEDLDHLSGIDPADFAAEWPWITERFGYFHERPFEEAESAANAVEASLAELRSSNMGALRSVDTSLGGWSGKARDAFTVDFANPLAQTVIAEQQRLLGELQAAMWAYDAVLRQGRLNGYNLAVETTKVLRSLTETSPNDAKVALGILAVVVSVITTFEAGGSGAAIALGLLGAGVSGASTGIDGASISGSTTADVMASLATALDDLTAEMNAAEQAIATAISATQEAVEWDLSHPESKLLPTVPDGPERDLTAGEVPTKREFHPRT